MKAVLNKEAGLSLVEIILALAIGTMLLTSIFESVRQIDDGLLWTAWRLEAYQFLVQELKSLHREHVFSAAVNVTQYIQHGEVVDPTVCSTQSCLTYTEQIVSDASCGQKRILSAAFKLRPNDSERFLRVPNYEFNDDDLIKRGGDCSWVYQSSFGIPTMDVSSLGGSVDSLGIDVFATKVIVVGSSSPQLRVYEAAEATPNTYELKTSTMGDGRRINAIDVMRHKPSGRLFAYVVFHDRFNQLGVFELFADNREPVLLTVRTLGGALAGGSFPQGWRLVVYGERLFVLTRETAGSELHIFSLADPAVPTEVIAARTELSRTVNDMDVLGITEDGEYKEYLFLGASAALKEFAIFDVTSGVPTEILAVNLPGTSNVESLYLTTNNIYLGRQSVSSGPELYQFALSDLLAGSTTPKATYEVGAGVSNIAGVGGELVVTTSRSPSDIDRYTTDALLWQTNNARLSRTSYPGLLPYASDRTDTGVVLLQRTGGDESIINLHTP